MNTQDIKDSKNLNAPSKGNVPALRFPEFSGEWKRHKLSEICSFYSGGTPSSSKKEYYNGNIPFIRSGELHKDKTELFITEDGLNNSAAKLVETGDLLLALYGATSGDIAISKIKGAINQAILCIRTKQNKKFIESVWNKHVERLLQTYLQGGQGNLSADIVKNIPFYFANLEEQDKLANFISLLDDRISIQSRIIEKYKSLIKAILVEHYRKCNKTEQFIHDIGEPFNVMNLSKDDLSKDGNPCIIYGELFTTYGCVIENVVSHTTKSPNSTLSTKGDLLFPASTTVDALSLIAPSAINEDGIILGGDMFGIHVNERNNSNYLSYYFNIIGKKNLAKYAKGSTIIHLHYADIQNAKITLPNKNEQEAIAKLLLNVEHKLNIEQKVLANHLNTKNFILQQMFI